MAGGGEDWETETNATEDEGKEDFQLTVALVSHLREENASLRDNFESLKKLHVALQEECRTLHSNARQFQNEKGALEVDLESAQSTLRSQAEELAKARFRGNNDSAVEAAKAEVRRELESVFSLKTDLLEKDNARLETNYYSLKAEYETLKAETETTSLHHEQMLKTCAADSESRLTALREQVAALKGHQERAITLQKSVKDLDMENDCLKNKQRELDSSLREARKERAEAFCKKDAMEIATERKLKQAKATEVELQGMVESMRVRISALQREVQSGHEKHLQSHAQILELQTTATELSRNLEQECQNHRAEVGCLKSELEDVQNQWEVERKDLEKQLIDRESIVSRLEADHEVDLLRAQDEYQKATAEMEQQHKKEAEKFQERDRQLQAETKSTKTQLDEAMKGHAEKVELMAGEIKGLRLELEKAVDRACLSEHRCTKLQSEVEGAMLQLENHKDCLVGHEARRSELTSQVVALKRELDTLEQRNQDMASQLIQSKLETQKIDGDLENERANHKHRIEELERSWNLKRSTWQEEEAAAARKLREESTQKTASLGRKIAKAKDIIKELRRDRHDMKAQINDLQAKLLEVEICKGNGLGSPAGVGVLGVGGDELWRGSDLVGDEIGGVDLSGLLEDMAAVQRRQQAYVDNMNS
ncbi:hypothetical protein BSKO_05051 [Bryopsis sp. KO-2023]|nr:hypothetical protein BSKO_05051 [Bryopsis sp. KO-2023]